MEKTSINVNEQDLEHERDIFAVLDPGDPIDAEIIRFKNKIHKEETPTQLEQKELIKKMRIEGDQTAAVQLFALNKGLVAAIAYQFKSQTFENTDILFKAGETALLNAAVHYDAFHSKTSFTNYAAAHVQASMQLASPHMEAPLLIGDEQQPILTVYKFLSTLRPIKQPELNDTIKQTLLENASLLRLLPMTDEELFEQNSYNSTAFYKKLRTIYDETGIPNRYSLALASKRAGIKFDIPKVPKETHFTPTERKIAPHLQLEFAEVAKLLGYSPESVERVSTGLRSKLGAKSRTELVLMLDGADLREPQREQKPKAFEEYTLYELKVLPFIHQETSTIMDLTGLTNTAVQSAMNKAFRRTGTNSRPALALYLVQRGFPLAVAPPKDSLSVLFHEKNMGVLKNLHLDRQELAQMNDMTEAAISHFVYEAKQKTGARTNVELLLMAHMFDNGERRTKDERTKRERLTDRLGWGTLNTDKLNRLLGTLNPKQQALIKNYYLSDENVSWSTIAKDMGIGTDVAVTTAHRGLLRIKNNLDTDSAA